MTSPFDLVLPIYFLLVAVLTWAIGSMISAGEPDPSAIFLVAPLLALLIGVAQAVLLANPAPAAQRRRIPQLPIWIPAVAAGFVTAFLLFMIAGLVLISLFGNEVPTGLEIANIALLATWLVWTILFWRIGRREGIDRLVDRATRWVLAGSLLELVVAVVAHVAVRRRGVCCGDAITRVGIVVGLALAALSFGPALGVLLVQRMRRKRGLPPPGPAGAEPPPRQASAEDPQA
jgi:hypothetical protein